MKTTPDRPQKLSKLASRSLRAIASATVVALTAAILLVCGAVPANAAGTSIANRYAYVSDQGLAAFTIPVNIQPGTTTPLYFYTAPGTENSSFGYNDVTTQKATSSGAAQTLDAYAADGSLTVVGTWTLPAGDSNGNFTQSSANAARIKLTVAPAFVGSGVEIRPLKVSYDPGAFFAAFTTTGTFYPMTLAVSRDVTATASLQGAAAVNWQAGSYINRTTPPGGFGDLSYNRNTPGTGTLLTGTPTSIPGLPGSQPGGPAGSAVTTLPMTASLANGSNTQIGVWTLTQSTPTQGAQLGWNVTVPSVVADTVVGVQPLSYARVDTRANSWSGWWNQSTQYAENNASAEGSPIDSNGYLLTSVANYTVGKLNLESTAVAPTAGNQTLDIALADTAATFTPSLSGGNGYFGTSNQLTAMSISGTSGEWTVNSDHTVTYTPTTQAKAAGTPVTAQYTITNEMGQKATGTLTATFETPIPTIAPTAKDVTGTVPNTASSTTLNPTYTLGAGINGAPETLGSLTVQPDDPNDGTWSVDNGAILFTPSAATTSAGKTVTASYTVTNSDGATATARITVTVQQSETPTSPSPSQASPTQQPSSASTTTAPAALPDTGLNLVQLSAPLAAALMAIVLGVALVLFRRTKRMH